MRHRLLLLLLLLPALATACVSGAGQSKPAQPASVDVFFSPKGGCQDAIVRELGAAKTSVRVQAYSFTSALSPHPPAPRPKRRGGMMVRRG